LGNVLPRCAGSPDMIRFQVGSLGSFALMAVLVIERGRLMEKILRMYRFTHTHLHFLRR